jgi:hypothetical protein
MRRHIFGSYAYAVSQSGLRKLLAAFPVTCPIDNFSPTQLHIYTAKGLVDWWHCVSHKKDTQHLFWGLAAPRGNTVSPSTIQ